MKSRANMKSVVQPIEIGLSLPLFAAGLVSLFVGAFTGLGGVWAYLAWKIAVPEYVKVGHAHTAWWSVLIFLSALFLPGINLTARTKRFVIWTSFIAPTLWLVCMAVYYISKASRGAIAPIMTTPPEGGLEYIVYGTGIFVTEVWLFLALAIVLISSLGFRIPRLSQDDATPSRYDLTSKLTLQRQLLWVPLIFGAVGLFNGWYMTLAFKAAQKPITPAAMVQLHDHILFFTIGFIIAVLTVKAVTQSNRPFRIVVGLGVATIPATLFGYLLFIKGEWSSLAYVLPAVGYYAMMGTAFLALLGFWGVYATHASFHYLRLATAFIWGFLLIIIAVGFLLAMVWDTTADVTVTYRQPEGSVYPGPYPTEYIGTQPVEHTPRGLENVHLSPGSWAHVAMVWLLALIIFQAEIFRIVGNPNLVFLFATTIPLAPLFNAIGRFAAWGGLPNGIGALYFVGHPMKMFNIVSLMIIVFLAIFRLAKQSPHGEKG